MTNFLSVKLIRVPQSVVEATYNHLAAAGRFGLEAFVLWAGTGEGVSFRVTEAIIPQQEGIRSAAGVCVTVGPGELHRINIYLHRNQLRLVGQIHSHPGEAYHSETDDAYPIATTLGSVSLVVPDFARRVFCLGETAVYRLEAGPVWRELHRSEVESLITIAG